MFNHKTHFMTVPDVPICLFMVPSGTIKEVTPTGTITVDHRVCCARRRSQNRVTGVETQIFHDAPAGRRQSPSEAPKSAQFRPCAAIRRRSERCPDGYGRPPAQTRPPCPSVVAASVQASVVRGVRPTVRHFSVRASVRRRFVCPSVVSEIRPYQRPSEIRPSESCVADLSVQASVGRSSVRPSVAALFVRSRCLSASRLFDPLSPLFLSERPSPFRLCGGLCKHIPKIHPVNPINSEIFYE